MYRITEVIENDGAPSLIPDAAFHPSGAYFAVVYQDVNEVRIYESQTRKLLHVLRNPESQLDEPHGILYTENYLVVANRHGLKRPSAINVYRNGGSDKNPIQIFQTPFDYLREAHSLALRDGRLVVTYCENVGRAGAIVCYGFNQKTGRITHPLDKIETWFSEYGDAKGICFNEDGTKLLVTFQSDWVPSPSIYEKILFSFEHDKVISLSNKLLKLSHRSIKNIRRKMASHINIGMRNSNSNLLEFEKSNPSEIKPNKNGIAVFSVNAEGKIDCNPEQTIVRKNFCRLENIDIFDGICAIPDTVHQAIHLYDMMQDPKLKYPFQTIDLGRTLPHGVRFSPDGRLLIIATFGKEVAKNRIQWQSWLSPREDKFFVCERAS
jgi:hypothetical protein